MTEYGFLRRNESGEFRLGQRFMQTALEKVALPVLTELCSITGETTQLWIRRGGTRVCILGVDSHHELRVISAAGTRLDLPAGSSGQLLAGEPDVLEELKHHDWVESVGLRTQGLGSVSAPVYLRGRIIAAVCVAMPLARVTVSPGADFGAAAADAARRISEDLEQRQD